MSNYWSRNDDEHGKKGVPGAGLPIRKGYGVKYIPETDPSTNSYTAWLEDQFGRKIYFWIEDMSVTVNINGSTGQSRSVRQFFPHNMSQPSFIIKGRHADSYRRNLFAIFVRESQYNALSSRRWSQSDANFSPLITLYVRGRTSDDDDRGEANPGSNTSRKGRGHMWKAEGYIKNIQAGAKRFDPGPEFEFEFLVAHMNVAPGFMEDGTWKPYSLVETFMETFAKRRPKGSFVQAAKPKDDKNKGGGTPAKPKTETPSGPVFGPDFPGLDFGGWRPLG